MLTYRTCVGRYAQTLDQPSAQFLRHVSPPSHQHRARLLHSRTRHVALDGARELDSVPRHKQDHWKQSEFAANLKKREYAALRKSTWRDEKVIPPNILKLGPRDPRIPESDWNRRKLELRHLQDPLALAKFVSNELAKDKIDEMMQLVIMASHSMECIVSWNHIINYYMENSKVSQAIKVYNDMKKRAQHPDAYTYTILLRGFSANAHLSGVVSKALSVYHSLYAHNSRVEPSIIHTNAALQVCARALDMDALWGIAGKIPEQGPSSANARTYVIIFNAIRQSLLLSAPKGETEVQAAARKDAAIVDARRMWEGIVNKWKNAEIQLDEELVCAMGRLLLVGCRPRDWDDVLSLIEQTMNLPRLIPRIGTEKRLHANIARFRGPQVPAEYRFDDDHLAPDSKGMRGDEFLAITSQDPSNSKPVFLTYVQPGNNALSLIQEACLKTAAGKASRDYWRLFTEYYTYVIPDLASFHMRMRNVRQTRNSADAVSLLREMFYKGVDPQLSTFRMAMSACNKDKNNPNSLTNAIRVLDMMLESQEDVDIRTVTIFAKLAVSPGHANGPDVERSLNILMALASNIRLQLGVGGAMHNKDDVGAVYLKGPERAEAIEALRKVYGAYDRLINSNSIEESKKARYKTERSKLGAFLYKVASEAASRQSQALQDALDGKKPQSTGMDMGTKRKDEMEDDKYDE